MEYEKKGMLLFGAGLSSSCLTTIEDLLSPGGNKGSMDSHI